MSEKRAFKGHVATVLVAGAVFLAVLFVLFRLAGGLALGGKYEVKAVVPQAGTLTQGTSVTMAGARVGTVTKVERRGNGALVDMRIDDKRVKPLPKESHARLSVRTPLGESYIEILPGSSRENLASGAIITPQPDDEYVDVDQILSTLHGKTRENARQMVQGLGAAVDGRGQKLNGTLKSTSSVLNSGTDITNTLVGQREEVSRLVQRLGNIGSALGEREGSINQIARNGLVTFRAVEAQDNSLRRFLDELPGTLRSVRQTTATLGSTSNTATPVVANLGKALDDVRPAVRNLAPAANEGTDVVRQLNFAAPPLEKTLTSVRRLSPKLSPALPAANKTLCQANPMLRYIEPYKKDLLGALTGLNGSTNSYDAISHTIRLMPVLSENSAAGLDDTSSKAAFDLFRAGVLQRSYGLSYDAYPKPGMGNRVVQPGEAIRGPQEYKQIYKYPHVTKDC